MFSHYFGCSADDLFRRLCQRFARGRHGHGSPVSVVLANLVMKSVEERTIFSFDRPPSVWWRFVEDTFVIMARKDVKRFQLALTHDALTNQKITNDAQRNSHSKVGFPNLF